MHWTEARSIAVLIIPLIAAIVLLAGSTSARTEQDEVASELAVGEPSFQITIPSEPIANAAPGIGSAPWALGLLDVLGSYEGAPPEKYDRDTYDVGWLDIDGDCQSGRHEVLIEESARSVQLDEDGCRVVKGFWSDPYSGTEIRSAQDASIDHVVSLADAHRSGGWRWSDDWRIAFANDLYDPATLAVSATQVNSAKGSGSPDRWMPKEDEARCAYAIAWVRVKTRWQLAVTEPERESLDDTLLWCEARGLPAEIESRPLRVVSFSATPFLPLDRARTIVESGTCDMRYETVCIPAVTGDLDCADIEPRRFAVTVDPHGFDGDDNGIGCEN